MGNVIIASQWAVILIVLCETWVVFKNMKTRIHHYLYMNCVAMLICSTGYLLSLLSESQEACFIGLQLSWGGKIWILVSILFFCIRLCNHELSNGLAVFVGGFAMITFAIIITTTRTGLFYKSYGFETVNGLRVFHYEKGPWFYLWFVMVIVTITACIVMSRRSERREHNAQKKKQYRLVTVAFLIIVLVGIPALLPVGRYYDFNQLGFTLCAILILYGIFRIKLMDVESVTRDFAIDELSSGIIALDTNGDMVYHNKIVEDIFPGIKNDPQSVIDQVGRSIQAAEPVVLNDHVYNFEEKKLGQDPEDESKIYILTDNTDYYHHLKEINEQKQIAEEANKAKSYFLASMSHEIRTPINTVLGMDEMILRESTEKPVKDYAMDIQAAGQTLLSIINDILDLSKIESGKMEILPVEYSTSDMVYDVTNLIRFRANDKNLTFKLSVSHDIPSVLLGDDVRVRQILMNLLSNAVKYTSKGYVWLRVSLKSCEYGIKGQDDKAILHFEVEDTGPGIKPEEINKMFSDFEKIYAERNRNIVGTGLGMPITMRLLRLMGSELKVQSQYGKGTTFSFDLSQIIVDKTPVGSFEKNTRNLIKKKPAYEGAFTAPDARILEVDDNSMNRKVFVSLLKPTQIRIVEASGGEEAIEKASRQHFDIIFMDHMMPELDGIEAMKRIKALKNGPCAHTPIIVLTANAVAGAKEQYLEEGFDGFLSKPVSSAILEDIIRENLPPEKIKINYAKAAADASRGNKDTAAAEQELPMIFGIDWKLALMRLQDRKILDAVLRKFEETLDQQADKLQSFKEGLPETFDDYRILVHGMKSSSASVGIIPMSGMAAVLEKAADNKDLDTVNRLHDVFMRICRDYSGKLGEFLRPDAGDKGEKEELSDDILETLLGMLASAMDAMDIDGADEAVRKLSSYKLPDRIASRFDKLKTAVAQLDQATVVQTLDEIRNEK